MKAKSLHFSKSGNVQPIASEIGRVMQCVCDQIPPAYPCEGEKVVFIGVEMNGKLPGAVDHFCKDLNPTRAKGVAFYVLNSNGNTDGLSSIIDTMKKNGVETYGEPLGIRVKGGLFKKGMPTDADTKKVLLSGQTRLQRCNFFDKTAFIIFHKKMDGACCPFFLFLRDIQTPFAVVNCMRNL